MEKHHKRKVLYWTVGILVCVGVLATLTAFWLYSGVASGARLQTLTWLGAPLGTVGDEYIEARDLEYFTLLGTSAGVGGPTAALVNELRLEVVAQQYNIQLSADEINATVAELRAGDTRYASFEQQYGPDVAARAFARPYAYTNALRIAYMKQGLEPALTRKLQSVYQRLDSDEAWRNIAAKESDDLATSWSGGDVGYVDLTQAIPEYRQAVGGLPLHSPAVIYSRYGAHIAEVLNRLDKDGTELTQLREIVLRPQGFEDWLADQTATVPVKWYVRLSV
ncbi:MAG: peptidylprolyl isomerase [Candidatus Doudnabacteria bacterium]|nr:peptidylprolyl isomerase [Candidatus Doudnabacteria bacterium]